MQGRAAVVIGLALLLGACGASGRSGQSAPDSSRTAYQAASAEVSAMIAAVRPTPQRIGGRLLVVMPSPPLFERVAAGSQVASASLVARVTELKALGLADGVQRGRLFDDVTVIRSLAPETERADGYDFKLWLYGVPINRWQWYFAAAGGHDAEPARLDPTAPLAEQANTFNASLLRAASALHIALRPGTAVTAASPPAAARPATPSGRTIWCVDPKISQLYSSPTGNCAPGDRQVSAAEAYDLWPQAPPNLRPAERPPAPPGRTEQTAAARPPQTAGKLALEGTGTGFVISPRSLVMTNHHVIAGCTAVGVATREQTKRAQVLADDPKNDLALLRTEPLKMPVANFRDPPEVRLGETVISYGFPLIDILTSSGNLTTGTVSGASGIADDSRFLQITAPVQPGNSGGPLLDTSGHVVGIVSSGLDVLKFAAATGDVPQNVNFAIRAQVARTFLDANDAPYSKAPSKTKLDVADVADLAKSFTVLVECFK